MISLLSELLFKNPEIANAADRICMDQDWHRTASAQLKERLEQVRALAGYPACSALEEAFNRYYAGLVDVYYLLGLGLREELIAALTAPSVPAGTPPQ